MNLYTMIEMKIQQVNRELERKIEKHGTNWVWTEEANQMIGLKTGLENSLIHMHWLLENTGTY